MTIYVLYLRRLSGAPTHEPHLVGPSAYIGSLPKRTRRIINYAMFVIAAGVILLCAEAFADVDHRAGRGDRGQRVPPRQVDRPHRLRGARVAGGHLVRLETRLPDRPGSPHLLQSQPMDSARRLAAHRFLDLRRRPPRLPLDTQQRVELFVTAAQSVFAVAIVASRSVSRTEAWVMLGLFVAQIGESLLITELGHLNGQQSLRPGSGSGSCSSSPRPGCCARISER